MAKNVFSLHGVDASGAVVLRKTVSRARLIELIAQQPACLIGLEACFGAHEWARRFQALGHTVKLMAPRFVAPYRKNGKNDGNDAEAICEAVTRPSMRFVPIKTLEQQAVLCLHRVRQGFIEERTATINRLRGLLAEFGFVLPQRAAAVRRSAAEWLEQLPPHAGCAIRDLREHLRVLDARVKEYERSIEAHARDHTSAQLVQQRLGIGPMTASAIIATVGDVREFKNGRQFSAWLGLVPRQHSTGGKQRLGHITGRGDPYLRTLLVLGARSVLQRARSQSDPLSRWALAVRVRRGYHRACIAVAVQERSNHSDVDVTIATAVAPQTPMASTTVGITRFKRCIYPSSSVRALRYHKRITPQLSGRVLPHVTWHFIHHGPLHYLLCGDTIGSLASSVLTYKLADTQ